MKKFLCVFLAMLTPQIATAQQLDTTIFKAFRQPDSLLRLMQPKLPPIQTYVFSGPPYVASYHPPLIYDRWWNEIERCVQLYIPREQERRVVWYYVGSDGFVFRPDSADLARRNAFFVGYTISELDTIIVVHAYILNQKIIKHEMIHYLMYHNGIPAGHPDKYFKRCKVE